MTNLHMQTSFIPWEGPEKRNRRPIWLFQTSHTTSGGAYGLELSRMTMSNLTASWLNPFWSTYWLHRLFSFNKLRFEFVCARHFCSCVQRAVPQSVPAISSGRKKRSWAEWQDQLRWWRSGNSAASQPTESLRPLYMLGVAGGMMSAMMQEEPPDLHWPARRCDLKGYVDKV